MNTQNRVVILTTLACIGLLGCQSATKDAAATVDTTAIQTKLVADTVVTTVSTPAAPVVAPPADAKVAANVAAKPVAGKPVAQTTVKAPIKPPAPSVVPGPDNAARADSIRKAQERADAVASARADSMKKADAARAAAARVEPVSSPVVNTAPASAGQEVDGKAPYEENCRKCHGVRGVPPKTMKEKFPKIATFDADFFTKHSADSIVTVLTKGKNEDMKSFKDKMSHAEMVAVAAYIRAFVH